MPAARSVKMASYNKDDFVTGSDFSDLSDMSEDELNVDDVLDLNDSEEDDDDRQYCVCDKPSTIEMIACDNPQCTVIWWHYSCVGLSSETIPLVWICERCRPSQSGVVGSTGSEPEPNDQHHSTSSPKHASGPEGDNDEILDEPATSALLPAAATGSCKRKGAKKAKKKGSSTPSSTNTKTDVSPATDEGNASTKTTAGVKKKVKKTAQKAPERPAAKFTLDDALKNAKGYYTSALEQMRHHPVFTDSYPIALCMMALVSNLLATTNNPEFQEFCSNSVRSLWTVVTAGDSKNLKPEAYNMVWREFHTFRLSSIAKWTELLTRLDLNNEGQYTVIAYQYLLQTVVDFLIKDRNKKDSTGPTRESLQSGIMTKEEEQVLRYVAGYVPFALHKKMKHQLNQTAQTMCKFLKSWKVCCSDTAKTFLEYTNQWIEVQNRGGLFHVSDGVYLFFRSMEMETRSVLNVANFDKFPGVDIQHQISEKVKSNRRVQTYWCSLTQGKITGEISVKLLDMVIKKWIKIRGKAFINVYLSLKKASGSKVSKKAEKALRKDL